MLCKVSSWWRITLSMQQRRWEHQGKETKSCLKLGKREEREERWGKMDESPWHPCPIWSIWTSSNFTWHTTNAIGDRVLASPCIALHLEAWALWSSSPSWTKRLTNKFQLQWPVWIRLTRLVVSECFRVVLESKRTHFIYFISLQFPQEIFSIFIHHFWIFVILSCLSLSPTCLQGCPETWRIRPYLC